MPDRRARVDNRPARAIGSGRGDLRQRPRSDGRAAVFDDSRRRAGAGRLVDSCSAHKTCTSRKKARLPAKSPPPMLRYFGVTHVIVGHSERRHIFKEDDELIAKRAAAVVAQSHDAGAVRRRDQAEHDAGQSTEVVLRQLQQGLARSKRPSSAKMIIAYEPVWAIGTGRNATPEQAEAGPRRNSRRARRTSAEGAPTRADHLRRQRHRRKC